MEDPRTAALVKAIIRSPIQSQQHAGEQDETEAILLKVQIQGDCEFHRCSTLKDLHQQRLNDLRQQLVELEKDDWKFDPVDKLIGLRY